MFASDSPYERVMVYWTLMNVALIIIIVINIIINRKQHIFR